MPDSTALAPSTEAPLKASIQSKIADLVVDSVNAPESRRAYSRAIQGFLYWYDVKARPDLSKAVVNSYKSWLINKGLSPSTISLNLTVVRRFVEEAADNGLVSPDLASGIRKVKGVPRQGRRTGNWLTKRDAQKLLAAPGTETVKGKRDTALLAVLLGAGLRRDEAARLTVEHVQQREGRWLIVDMSGKHGRVRSIPIPSWTKAAVDGWLEAAGITEGRSFRAILKDKVTVQGEGISAQAIWNTVKAYSDNLGLNIAPHDLRRTFAKLAHSGGSPIEQIQLSLGHASIQTTERYLGIEQDLSDAPCDRLGLRLPSSGC